MINNLINRVLCKILKVSDQDAICHVRHFRIMYDIGVRSGYRENMLSFFLGKSEFWLMMYYIR